MNKFFQIINTVKEIISCPIVGQLISEASDITPGFVITNMAYHYISNIKKSVETYKFFPHAVTAKNGVSEFPW